MDYIKEAFNKVRQDIEFLKDNLNVLKEETFLYKNYIKDIDLFLNNLRKELSEMREGLTFLNKSKSNTSTQYPLNKTDNSVISTDKVPLYGLKEENNTFSIGNKGVPTDKQTDKQTNKQVGYLSEKEGHEGLSLDNALNLLNSLDSIKKEIRIKFKKLTDQEILVFSTIYQFDEEKGYSNYKMISDKLNLTESSIRDYVGRLIKKGIPLEKIKINNKNIKLNISENLKKIASLSAILQLREI